MNTPSGSMVGGPVGAMNSQNHAVMNATHEQLNTYIYDHLLRLKHFDLARQFYQTCQIKVENKPKKEMNGEDMDMDSKDDLKRPDDLPIPNLPGHYSENSFLYDWWCQFWDIFGTARGKGSNPISQQYLGHNSNQVKARQMQQNAMMGGHNPHMMNRQQQFAGMQPNGIQNMQKQAIANRSGMPQMMANKMQPNMQDGDRPASPSAMGGNAPSPSKRPRIDEGQQFNGQPGPAGRGQPMPGAQMGSMPGGPNGNMMMQNGVPQNMNQMNFTQNGNGEMAGAVPQGMEGSLEMMNQSRQMSNGAANASQGNHALQDYQMQLMLLEQQNKKRLLMARQEQDNINHVPGSTQPGFPGAPAMSPQNGRPGPSPNPSEQMKRQMQTPKMGNLPGSPAMAGDMNRGSPVPIPGFDQNSVPPNMRQQIFAQQGMMAQGQPPSSHPNFNLQMPGQMTPQNMEQMRHMQARGQMPNGQWPQGGQPMMQSQSQPGQVGTPQQRNAMPPPPAPNTEQQRTQPSSPAQPAGGPPTPSQAPKSAPKGKKEAAKKTAPPQKPPPQKKDAATPAAADAPPATPNPSTPITPMHQNSFNKGGAPGSGAAPAQQPGAAPVDPNAPAPFDLGAMPPDLDLGFPTDGPDVLENFDFDSFLHNTDDGNSLGNFDFMHFGLDGTEASAGN